MVEGKAMQAQIVQKTLIAHHYKKMCKDQAMSQVQMAMKTHKPMDSLFYNSYWVCVDM